MEKDERDRPETSYDALKMFFETPQSLAGSEYYRDKERGEKDFQDIQAKLRRDKAHEIPRRMPHDLKNYNDVLDLVQEQLKTPVMQALEKGYFQTAEEIISKESKIEEFRDKAGKNVMMYPQTLTTIKLLVARCSTDDINAEDRMGQSVLMWALQQNDKDTECQIAKYLIEQGADIHVKDNAGRSSLTYAVWKSRLPVVEILLARGINPNELDRRHRNALHHLTSDIARAQRGSTVIDRQVLEALLKAGADPNAKDWDGHTCFYSALLSGNVGLAEDLLKSATITVNIKTEAGWSFLHAACEQPLASVGLVQKLIDEKLDVNEKTPRTEKTPLHLAAQAGNIPVVKYLLEHPRIDRHVHDSFGNSPLLCASLHDPVKRKAFGDLFAPWRSKDKITRSQENDYQNAQLASEHWEATVVDFSRLNQAGSSIKQYRMSDLIRRPHRKYPNEPYFSTVPSDNEPGAFRWIHLPANNITWCKDLLHKYVIETDCADVYGFRDIERSLHHQHCGLSDHLHSRYMTPLCTQVFGSASSEDRSAHLLNIFAVNNKSFGKKKFPERPAEGKDDESGCDPSIKHLIMFMPYLHYETFDDMCEMEAEIEKLRKPGKCSENDTAERKLFRAYLTSATQSLHMRRTLDQFFYHNIDTKVRNRNQVIYRHQKRNQAKKPKILMVDQLWMWVIDRNLIITSFPHIRRHPSRDPMDILEIVKELMRTQSEEPIDNVYELASLIVSSVGGALVGHGYGKDGLQVLNMFESEVGAAMDIEVKLFEAFQNDAQEASTWLTVTTSAEKKKEAADAEEGLWEEANRIVEKNERKDFFRNLLDIGSETNLLKEVKDIRDELGMLRVLFTLQKQIVPSFQKALKTISRSETQWKRLAQHVENFTDEQNRIFEHPLEHVRTMDDQAKLIYQSIRDLMELKQKHVNAIEAHYSRFQADSTARQGKTLMVFTIVTVIFLPLSFIAAVMTINITEFPRDGAGTLALSWVAEYIFGVGIPIAIVCVLAALLVGPLATRVQPLYYKLVEAFGFGGRAAPLHKKLLPPIVYLPPTRTDTTQSGLKKVQTPKSPGLGIILSRRTSTFDIENGPGGRKFGA